MTNYYEENFRAHLPEDRNAAILDIGCGQGDFVRYLHELGYRNITAVDLDERAIAALQDLDSVTVIARRMDGEALRALGRKWDLIFSKQMIIYLDRHQAPNFARAMAECLTDDGRVICDTFNAALLSAHFTEHKDPYIFTSYTDLGLKRLLEWNGLEVEALFGCRTCSGTIRSRIYHTLQAMWFGIYRLMLILERGRDDELPRIGQKSIIAVARRRSE